MPEPVEYHPGALERDNGAFLALSEAMEAHLESRESFLCSMNFLLGSRVTQYGSRSPGVYFVALEAIFQAIDTHPGAILGNPGAQEEDHGA